MLLMVRFALVTAAVPRTRLPTTGAFFIHSKCFPKAAGRPRRKFHANTFIIGENPRFVKTCLAAGTPNGSDKKQSAGA